MFKLIPMLAVSMLLLNSAPALAVDSLYGFTYEKGNAPFDHPSHAEWATVCNRQGLRLASDLGIESQVAAAVVDGWPKPLKGKPVDTIEFTYKKNVEKEADPVLRFMGDDGVVHTARVKEMTYRNLGSFRVTTYKLKTPIQLKLIAVCAQAHKQNNDGCNFEVTELIRWRDTAGDWHTPEKNDLEIRVKRPGSYNNSENMDRLLADLYK